MTKIETDKWFSAVRDDEMRKWIQPIMGSMKFFVVNGTVLSSASRVAYDLQNG